MNPSLILAMTPISLDRNGPFGEFHVSYDGKISGIKVKKVINQLIEDEILKSFADQPMVRGAHFDGVRSYLKKGNLSDRLHDIMRDVYITFTKEQSSANARLTWECRHAINFVTFYHFCVSDTTSWVETLNRVSIQTQLGDTALIPVIFNWKRASDVKGNDFVLSLSVILIETNNGKLIWGKMGEYRFQADAVMDRPMETLRMGLQSIFRVPSFWESFPGYDKNIGLKHSP